MTNSLSKFFFISLQRIGDKNRAAESQNSFEYSFNFKIEIYKCPLRSESREYNRYCKLCMWTSINVNACYAVKFRRKQTIFFPNGGACAWCAGSGSAFVPYSLCMTERDFSLSTL